MATNPRSNRDRVLDKAEKAFARYDKAKAALRAAEVGIAGVCREYDLVSGCRGIRPEGVRYAINERRAKQAA